MRRFTRLAVTAVVAIGLGAPGSAALADVPQHRVTLTGAQEAPDPGDPNGRGQFSWSLDGRDLCYLLSVRRIGTAAAAHVHRGRVGVAGPVRVELGTPTPASAGCVTVSAALAQALRDHPRRFYVNVHTAAYPGGAVRAQLTR
ncbi:MAG: CHRD domain-containing protein [Actinomycetes bacterium]